MSVVRVWYAVLLDVVAFSTIVLTGLAWASASRQSPPPVPPTEKYDPRLQAIRDLDSVVRIVRAAAPDHDRYAQARALEELLRLRFYHGYSRYSFSENWGAWLAARLIHPDLDAKVLPEEVISHPWAACSQQAIVVQAALESLGISFATVEWPSHFSAAAFIAGQWYVVDPWGPIDRDRSKLWRYEDWVAKETRARILGPKSDNFERDLAVEPPRLTKLNKFPASTMAWFHPVTKFLSDWLWVLALGWGMLRLVHNQVGAHWRGTSVLIYTD